MNHLLTRSLLLRNLHRNCFFKNQSALASNFLSPSRTFATKSSKGSSADPAEDPDKPIDFLQSPAASWKAQYSAAGVKNDAPPIEMWSVLISVAVFLLYFCILREENDIDEKIKQPLYNSVPGLEHQNLIAVHKYNADNQQDNKKIEARMRELGMDVKEIRKQHYH